MNMIHRDTQSVACGLSVWCDTPWIRVKPYEGNEYRLPEAEPVVPNSMKVISLTAGQMTAHRLRGHTPYEPSCEVCQSCKGVHRHPGGGTVDPVFDTSKLLLRGHTNEIMLFQQQKCRFKTGRFFVENVKNGCF